MPQDLSPILPEKLQVTFPARRCAGSPADDYPSAYVSTVKLSDLTLPDPGAGGAKGVSGKTLPLRSTATALYSAPGGASPFNQAALDALARQLATDLLSWRLVSFDTEFFGIVAPDPNGLVDLIEWEYTAERVSTRMRSAPVNGDPEEYQHQDPAVSTCISNAAVGWAVTPNVRLLAPIGPNYAASGQTNFAVQNVGLERGRLVATPEGVLLDCVGCPDCKRGLCVTLADFCHILDWLGSTVTITRLDDGYTDTGIFNGPDGFSWSRQHCFDLPEPAAGTWRIDVVTPLGPCSQTITITGSCPQTTAEFCRGPVGAYGCLDLPIKGVSFEINTPCTSVARCTSDSSGGCCPDYLTYGGKGTVSASKAPRWAKVTKNAVACGDGFHANNGGMVPAANYVCSCACNEPVARTLYLTDPWGTTTLTYDPAGGGSSSGAWVGTSGYNAGPVGACGSGPITYTLYNNGESTGGGGSLFPCLGIGSQLNVGGVIFNGDLTIPLSGLGGTYGGTLVCPDSATGTALLWTGRVNLCSVSFNVTVTE